jgi:LmbE family N-acetylglucosaminyl deacetylase
MEPQNPKLFIFGLSEKKSMKTRILSLLFLFLSIQNGFSQQTQSWNSSEIYQAIEKLNFLGSVLYVAAHPDDENTQLISYFSNETNARTAYLSLTRGDGGQNLIGPEIRELLGIIRTQELLSARRIDGGIQFFTRANDFGYSKTPTETLAIWDKKEVLDDVVWIIRKFRPDVIVNRFDIESAGETHGHHTSSAMLSAEAFELAGNSEKFSDQLQYVETWNPKRLYFNTSWWFYGSRENFKKADKSGFATLDAGIYFPLQGLSNTEIAAKSRSQHKSQGFGVSGSRGSEIEYLQPVKGDFPENADSIFAGIDTSWSRLENGGKIGKILTGVQKNYNFKNPAASIPKLLEAYKLIQALDDEHWREIKSAEIEKIILAAAGIYLEVSAKTQNAVPGENIPVSIEAINRSDVPINLESVNFPKLEKELSLGKSLKNNIGFTDKIELELPEKLNYSTPYWLNGKQSLGMYHVKNQQLIGLPETPPVLVANFVLEIDGVSINVEKPVIYKSTDPVKGEVRKPLNIVPKVSVAMNDDVVVFSEAKPKTIFVSVKAYQNGVSGKLSLDLPQNWKATPEEIEVGPLQKGSEKTFSFEITPPQKQAETNVHPEFNINGKTYSKELVKIDYPHIRQKNVLLPSKAKLVRLDIAKDGERIAYIEGAGDMVAESLGQIGYDVTLLPLSEITPSRLANFDAVVMGIRAYNVRERLGAKQNILFDYVKNGGNLIVQYNKSYRLKVDELAPYPLALSRKRVTDENSEVVFLAENHPILNTPNKITKADFEGWVQERGLYFPNKWSGEFTPILGMKDNGEAMTKGSLLVAKHGKGYYIYTGLSFFRELPAGVPGAYRLFANILSLGK